jgi:hypothetical protein
MEMRTISGKGLGNAGLYRINLLNLDDSSLLGSGTTFIKHIIPNNLKDHNALICIYIIFVFSSVKYLLRNHSQLFLKEGTQAHHSFKLHIPVVSTSLDELGSMPHHSEDHINSTSVADQN